MLGLLLLLLLRRYRQRKQQSHIRQTSTEAGPDHVTGELDDKAKAGGGDGGGPGDVLELHGVAVPNELEGSVGEGRMELA